VRRTGRSWLLLVLVAGLVGCAPTSTGSLPSSEQHGGSPSASHAHKAVNASGRWPRQVNGHPDKGYPGELTVGSEVADAAVSERTSGRPVRYGLATCGDLLGTAYPVRRTAGQRWRIAGPELYRAAAQAAESVSYTAARRGIIALWGASVVTSPDGGHQWWRSYLAGGIRSVSVRGRAFVALVQGGPVPGSSRMRTAMYASEDGGRSWRWVRSARPTSAGPTGARGDEAPACG
jgi:hypothetical protein